MPGDEIVGYVSLGRGITIHRDDCPNVKALKRAPERFVEVSWDGENETSYRVELQIDAYDRTRLLEDLSRTFSEAGINIIEARCTTNHPMVKNRFVVEVGDTEQLKQCISRLRNVESVFDAYRDHADRAEPQATTVRAPGREPSARTCGLLADVVAVDLDREGPGAPSLVARRSSSTRRLGDVVEVRRSGGGGRPGAAR